MRIGNKRRFAAAVVVLAATLAAGCSIDTHFVYKPGPPDAGGVKRPARVAVLPFANATEEFSKRGSIFKPEQLTYNVSRTQWGGVMDALPPEFWAKAFAEDLQASGIFRSARFVYSQAELGDEEYVVDGAVERAYIAAYWWNPSDFAVRLRLSARPGGRVVGEQVFSKTWTPGDLGRECGASPSCQVQLFHKKVNEAFRDIFAGARAWLAQAVSPASGEGAGAPGAGAGLAEPPAPATGRQAVYGGVGLVVGVRDGSIVVQEVIDGGPAAGAGLKAGDTIVAVDGAPVGGLPVGEFVRKIRGVPGTAVTLTVSRPGWGAPREVHLIRAEIGAAAAPSQAPASVEETIRKILEGK